jgi:hypothetical protein
MEQQSLTGRNGFPNVNFTGILRDNGDDFGRK